MEEGETGRHVIKDTDQDDQVQEGEMGRQDDTMEEGEMGRQDNAMEEGQTECQVIADTDVGFDEEIV